MKKLTTILALALSSVMILASCGKPAEKPTEPSKAPVASEKESEKPSEPEKPMKKEAKDLNIQMVSKGFQHQFWQAVYNGAKRAAEEAGIDVNDPNKFNFVGPNAESDVQGQMTQVQTALATKPDVLCFASVNVEASKEYVKQAHDAGIPIIGFDSGVPDEPAGSVLATAATDNAKAGGIAAEELYKMLKDKIDAATKDAKVRIAVSSQDNTSESVMGRTFGFIDKFIELVGADKVAVVNDAVYTKDAKGNDRKQPAEADASVILEAIVPASTNDADVVASISPLLTKEDTIGFYGSNELTAKNVLVADESYNKLGTDIIAVGFDSGSIVKQGVRDGKLAGAVTQAPDQIGYQAVKLAIAAATGDTANVKDVDTGAQFYTAKNIDSPEISVNLYD